MGDAKIEKAFCARMDHGGCGVLVEVEQGRIVNIKGDPNCPMNFGKLCPKGPAAVDRIDHPDRLTSPLKRTGARGGGEWAEISWEEALGTISERITACKAEFGAESIVFAEGAPRGLEYLFTYRLAAALGTPNVVTTGAVCFAPRWGAAQLTCGFYPKPDVENSECIVVWGNNAAATSADSTMGFQVGRAMQRGAFTIVIDPKKTELAADADLWLPVKPGTDAALALGMLNVIVSEDLHDESFAEENTEGFDELRRHLAGYDPETVSKITWIPTETIRETARRYASTKPAAILWGNGLEHNINSVQVNRALVALMAMTGNLGIDGGNVDRHDSTLRAPREFILAERMKGLRDNMIGAEYPMAKMLGFVPSSAAVKAILEDDPYPVKLMLVHTSNPVVSYANSKKVVAALRRLDFLVVTDLFMTPTAALADIVLPAATNYEFRDLGHYGVPWGTVHARPKLVDPVGQCWSDIKIMNELAKKLGLDELFWDDVDECIDYILQPSGLDFDSLRDITTVQALEKQKGTHPGFRTRSGKVELYSRRMEKWGAPPLPDYSDPVPPDDRYPYTLVSGKERPFFHTSLRNIPRLRKLAPEPTVRIHPDLASAHDLKEGDVAAISTDLGEIRQIVKLDESLHPGLVYCDYGWWFPEHGVGNLYGWRESNVNVLTDDDSLKEPLIGTTTQRGLNCDIRKAPKTS